MGAKGCFSSWICGCHIEIYKATSQQGRKTFVLLGCERSGKYRKYRNDLEVSITRTKKCDCPFRLRGKPISNGEG